MTESRTVQRRAARGTFAALAATVGLIALAGGKAHAAADLVGFELFSPDSTGNNQGSSYTYTTNSNIDFARDAISLNGGAAQQTAISFALAQGNNPFTFTAQANFPTSIAGINLFFSSSSTSYNPTTTIGVAGNLTVVANTDNSGTFFFPAASTPVRTYDNSGSDANYSGATSYVVGGQRITLTQYLVNSTPSGSFMLNVTPVSAAAPEPGTVILMGAFLLPMGGLVARRRLSVRA